MASTGSVAEIGERGRDRWEKLDQPRAGWVAWKAATAGILVRYGGGWSPVEVALDLLVRSSGVEPAKAVLGSSVSVAVEEELISSLSGASVDTALAIIPDRAIVVGVSVRAVPASPGRRASTSASPARPTRSVPPSGSQPARQTPA